jgi:hypothetical protein
MVSPWTHVRSMHALSVCVCPCMSMLRRCLTRALPPHVSARVRASMRVRICTLSGVWAANGSIWWCMRCLGGQQGRRARTHTQHRHSVHGHTQHGHSVHGHTHSKGDARRALDPLYLRRAPPPPVQQSISLPLTRLSVRLCTRVLVHASTLALSRMQQAGLHRLPAQHASTSALLT